VASHFAGRGVDSPSHRQIPIRPGVDLSRSVIVEVTLTTGRTFRAEPITIGDPPMTMGRSSFSSPARGRPGNPLGPPTGKNPSGPSSGLAYFGAPVVFEKPSGFGLFADTVTSPFRLSGAFLAAPRKRRKPALRPVFVFSLAREAPSKKRSGGGRGVPTRAYPHSA
jgi:hypothetical protein